MSEVPEGFERMELGRDFAGVLGAVYRNRERRQLGFRVLEAHANPIRTCHGGAIAVFCDLQIAALFPRADPGSPHRPTISLSIDFVAPVPLNAWVQAQVNLVRETRTLVFTSALLTVDGATVARSNSIYRNRTARSSDAV